MTTIGMIFIFIGAASLSIEFMRLIDKLEHGQPRRRRRAA